MDDSESPPSTLEDVTRSKRSSDHQHRAHRSSKDRERTYMGGTAKEIARLLMYEEREAKDLRKMIYALTEQLKSETQRADAAEMQATEAVLRLKSANTAKLAAEQDASRANEELQLYKQELERARKELHRAKEIIDTLDAQRLEAEEAAAKARTKAQRFKEQNLVHQAREEGRRLGLQEGLSQGRRLGYEEGRAAGYEHGHASATRTYMTAGRDSTIQEEDEEDEGAQLEMPVPSLQVDEPTPQVRHAQPPPSNRISFPVPEPAEPSVRTSSMTQSEKPPQTQEIHPIIVHNARVPSPHPQFDNLPDGFIPKQDGDHRIRIPPPHEMGPMPSPPPPVIVNKVSVESIPLMIPPPFSAQHDSAVSDSEGAPIPSGYQRPKHIRRHSDESESTTISQFEILAAPSVPSRLQPVLSAIQEEREKSSTVSSPNVGSTVRYFLLFKHSLSNLPI